MSAGLIVVGGGPAGHFAATSYRETGGEGPVRLLCAEAQPPYHRPPLSKDYLRGELANADLPIESQTYYRDHDIDLRLSTTVVRLDRSRQVVVTGTGEELAYDACVLATGSDPLSLPVDGGDHPDVHRLRSRHGAENLRSRAADARSAVVVGSGFIGCEAAVSLARRGLEVTLVTNERLPQVDRLGEYAAARISSWLRDAGVRLIGGVAVARVEAGQQVHLDDGSAHGADLVLTAVGVRPESGLAQTAGLTVDQGRILVDERLRTEDRAVFAAGDVALARNATADRPLMVEHWGEAVTMGQIAGCNAAGRDRTWSNAPGFWSEIGSHTIKYAAWGDGFNEAHHVEHGPDAFTVWYSTEGVCVGVLTHETDSDYERGIAVVESKGAPPAR